MFKGLVFSLGGHDAKPYSCVSGFRELSYTDDNINNNDGFIPGII